MTSSRFPWLALTVALVALAAVFVLVLTGNRVPALQGWESAARDVRTALFSHSTSAHHPHVALVTIDDAALGPFANLAPIDRALLARLIKEIDQAGPAAIGVDLLFVRPTERRHDVASQRALLRANSPIVLGGVDHRVPITEAQHVSRGVYCAHRSADRLSRLGTRDRPRRALSCPTYRR